MNTQENTPLSQFTTFQIGGPADYFCQATTIQELQEALEFAASKSLPFFILAGGSNILFHDAGFRGLIIKLEIKSLEFTPENHQVQATAGVTIAALIQQSVLQEVTGFEKWMGLPGTVGAAVRGNAGCNGLEVKDCLMEAQILNPSTGQISTKTPEDLNFSYRHSALKESDQIVLSAIFKCFPREATKEAQLAIMKEIRSSRIAVQPFGPSIGSFFKNSPNHSAGRLIESVGLKGHAVNQAKISEKHANFLINTGGATQEDILALARLARKKVQEKHGITLEEEVQILSTTGKINL